ncbi:hypothetical protein SORBI_3004G180100, partial [Sorghum bicolor]
QIMGGCVAIARDVQRYPSPPLGNPRPGLIGAHVPRPACPVHPPPLHLQLTDSLAPPARRESRQPPRFPPPPSFIRNGSSSPGLPFVSPPAPLLSVAPARAQLSGPGAGYARARVLLFRRSQPRLAMPPSPPPPSSLHHQRPTTPPPALSRFPSGALAS